MSELRWILIGFGLVLLAAIYLWGRRASRAAAAEDAAACARPEPALHAPVRSEEPWPTHAEAAVLPGAGELNRTAGEARPARAVGPPAPADYAAAAHCASSSPDTWRGRVEPTLIDASTEELPVRPEPAGPAPTLSSSEAPPARRIERRKILSLRLAMAPQRIEGAKLLETLLAESLQHGKYDIFHRLHTDGTVIFSIASMVEPGAFDLEKMGETLYPGVTLFAQLPAAVPGMHALNELVACARRLQQNLGGTLQDERGVPLTVHRIERMRQEVREFERPPAGGRGSTPSHSAHL